MKASLFLLLLLIVAVGCKTTKEFTSSKTQVSELLKNDIRSSKGSTSDIDVKRVNTDLLKESDSLVYSETIVELSKPDSTGSQHPTRVIHREASQVKKTENQSTASADSIAATASSEQLNDNTTKQTNTDTEEESAKKTKSTPLFPLWVWLIPIGAALFFLKRFGAFTWLGGVIVRAVRFISI